MATPQDDIERDQRKKAVQKFLARAEISMVREFLLSLGRVHKGCESSGLHGMPIHSTSSFDSIPPDVVDVLLISNLRLCL